MENRTERHFEVVVVGGGAAGLSGALVLARARRSVLVVDAGRPRNAPAAGVHSFLTREGIAPAELVRLGRDEVRSYGGQIREGTVAGVERRDGAFAVRLDDGETVTADRLLLATGLVDELPPVPGLAARWGRDVLHCPYCHGWEVRDEPVAVLSTGPMAVHQALLWRQWTDTVTFLRHTGPDPSPDDLERLAARGVAVIDGEVAALEVADDRLVGVTLADGASVACRALVVGGRLSAESPLLAGLGVRMVDLVHNGHVLGVHVEADATGATAVPGVWVAGNAANPMAQVVSAMDAGVRAAGAINADLIEAQTQAAVKASRQALGE